MTKATDHDFARCPAISPIIGECCWLTQNHDGPHRATTEDDDGVGTMQWFTCDVLDADGNKCARFKLHGGEHSA